MKHKDDSALADIISQLGSERVAAIMEDVKFINGLTDRDFELMEMSGSPAAKELSPDEQKRLSALESKMPVMLKRDKKKSQTDEERIAMYAQYGVEVTVPKGRSWHSKSLMCAEHDGVPYCMDEHSHFFEDDSDRELRHSILHRKLMIERHHEKIKAIYEYCVGLDVGDIWVMAGGGAQLQAFFGNSTGYLAILYLDMEDLNECVNSDYLKAIGNTKYTLKVNFSKNNKYFLGKFKMPGITLSKSM
ncbi:MAG: hypothetical protein RSG77_21775 [Hafnia sp.]